MNFYLAESLNVELINIILQGITLFAAPCFPEILRRESRKNKKEQLSFKDLGEFKVRKLNLDRIQIKNAKSWDGAKADTFSFVETEEIYPEDRFDSAEVIRIKIKDVITIYEDVKVYDYAHKAFHKLRYEDGITKDMIRHSLDPEKNLENAKKAGESTGKSGSFFFFSKDKKFIIKTMFKDELDSFMLNLESYFKHIEEGESMLARIYGIF